MHKGYLKVDRPLSEEEVTLLKIRWEKAMQSKSIPVLGMGVSFVPFETSPLDPSIVTCGYCGQWAALQTECKHCGATVR